MSKGQAKAGFDDKKYAVNGVTEDEVGKRGGRSVMRVGRRRVVRKRWMCGRGIFGMCCWSFSGG